VSEHHRKKGGGEKRSWREGKGKGEEGGHSLIFTCIDATEFVNILNSCMWLVSVEA